MRKTRIWIAGYCLLVICALGIVAKFVVKIDPYFHYHKPLLDVYKYSISNQRSQNNGITKHFDYDALITGTSMTENFKTSELDDLFDVHSIKVSYSGGSYKEINDNLICALEYNPELKIIVRGLDMYDFIAGKDRMRNDMGKYPTYLYDNNPFNDVQYLFNRSVVFDWVYPMVTENDKEGFVPGITSFDAYSNWMAGRKFGFKTVCPNGINVQEPGTPVHLTEKEKEIILANIRQNVTSLAAAYPDVTFYYFFPPYSAYWWQGLAADGTIYRQVEAEQVAIEEIMQYSNIKLYSFNNRTDITTDFNHYKDSVHYASWINSLILRWMHDGQYCLTYDNYQDYLTQELMFYTSFDYGQLAGQVDYENDYYAAALTCKERKGMEPLVYTEEMLQRGELSSATIVSDQYNGTAGIECRGAIQRDYQNDVSIGNYLIHSEYVGCKLSVNDIKDYDYLLFYGKKSANHGQPYVALYDTNDNELAHFYLHYNNIDNEWHQYLMDISKLSGEVTIIFNGGYIDYTGSPESLYTFSNITLY